MLSRLGIRQKLALLLVIPLLAVAAVLGSSCNDSASVCASCVWESSALRSRAGVARYPTASRRSC